MNPFRTDSTFPFRGMASVGLAFYVAASVRTELRDRGWFRARPEPDVRDLLDLVALGTVADLVPLNAENRILTALGMRRLQSGARPGIAALLASAGVDPDREIDARTIAWKLAPRLNAPGRLGAAALALSLLLAEHGDAVVRAEVLEQANTERRSIQDRVVEEALARLEGQEIGPAIVIAGENWPMGVVGIVAAKLVDKYQRPAFVIGVDPVAGIGRGSAHTRTGVSLYEALHQAAQDPRTGVLRWGGHAMAAGFTVGCEHIAALAEALGDPRAESWPRARARRRRTSRSTPRFTPRGRRTARPGARGPRAIRTEQPGATSDSISRAENTSSTASTSNKAIDDKASEIKNDITTRLADDKLKGSVRTPSVPLGTVIVTLDDSSKLDQVKTQVNSDYNDREKTVEFETCPPGSDSGSEPTAPSTKSLCFVVSTSYADGIKKSALTDAVATIRDRINEKCVAEPSVVEKGDDIIVELPGNPNSPAIVETEELIARAAKLEMKIVDDYTNPPPTGCTKDGTHNGSTYMLHIYQHLHPDKNDNSTDPEACRLEIRPLQDHWKPEEGGGSYTDFFLDAPDRDERVPLTWAQKHGKLTKDSKIQGDPSSPDAEVSVSVSGREIIERYLFGDPDLSPPYPGLIATDKAIKVPDDHQIS